MTPKENAIRLYKRFYETTPTNVNEKHDNHTRQEPAKILAKICIDEIIIFCTDLYESEMVHFKETGHFEYLSKTKTEIENL